MSIWRLLPDWMYFLSAKGKEYKKHLKVIHDFTSKVSSQRVLFLPFRNNS